MNDIQFCYILAGGQSTRFGSNKATVAIEGVPLLWKLSQEIEKAGLRARVVAQSEADYLSLGIHAIPDGVSQAGPFAGMLAALNDCQKEGDWGCFVTSCDTVEWRFAWQAYLLRGWQDHSCSDRRGDAAEGALPTRSRGQEHVQVIHFESGSFCPFPCLVSVGCLASAQEYWSSGGRSIRGWLDRLGEGVRTVSIPERELPRSFNSPDELQTLLLANKK